MGDRYRLPAGRCDVDANRPICDGDISSTGQFVLLHEILCQLDQPNIETIQTGDPGVSGPTLRAHLCRLVFLHGALLSYALDTRIFGDGDAVFSARKRIRPWGIAIDRKIV